MANESVASGGSPAHLSTQQAFDSSQQYNQNYSMIDNSTGVANNYSIEEALEAEE